MTADDAVSSYDESVWDRCGKQVIICEELDSVVRRAVHASLAYPVLNLLHGPCVGTSVQNPASWRVVVPDRPTIKSAHRVVARRSRAARVEIRSSPKWIRRRRPSSCPRPLTYGRIVALGLNDVREKRGCLALMSDIFRSRRHLLEGSALLFKPRLGCANREAAPLALGVVADRIDSDTSAMC